MQMWGRVMQNFAQKFRWIGVSALAISLGLSGCAPLVRILAEQQDGQMIDPQSVQTPAKDLEAKLLPKRPNSDEAATIMRGKLSIESKKDYLQNYNSKEVSYEKRMEKNSEGKEEETYKEIENPQKNTFLCAQYISSIKTTDPLLANEYLKLGLNLSNELCDNWFRKMNVTTITLNQTSDLISSTGTLATAMLNMTRVNAAAIGGTNSLFVFLKTSADSVAANYVVTVDLPSVSAAVRDYRAQYYNEILTTPKIWDYYQARNAVMTYDNTCSALAVKRFVNSRVLNEKPAKPTNLEPMSENILDRFVMEQKIFSIEPGQNLKKSDLIYIYGTLYLDTGKTDSEFNKDATKRFKELFGTDGKVKFITTKDNFTYDRNYLKNTLIIANIDSYLASKTNEKITELNLIQAEKPANTKAIDKQAQPNVMDTETQGVTTQSVSRNIFIPPAPVQ